MNIRLNEVRKYIENHGEATVETLTELLGCSKMTVWRYLKQLEDEGSIRRVRNGAIATSLAGDTEGLYSQRMHENADAKLSIARAAIPYLVPNTSIFLDAGTTVMSLVRQLPNQHYTIVTSGANIAIELSQRSRSTVSCVGGQISSSTLSLSGPQAEAFLATVNIDTAVLAATGGLYRRLLYRKFPQAPCNTKGRQGHTPHRPLKAGAHPPLHLRLPV